MTLTVEAGARVVQARPLLVEVAVIRLPADAVAVVHHAAGVKEYSDPGEDQFLVVPGDRDTIGWGCTPCWYGSTRGVRNGRHRLDRDAWHAAARAVERDADVAYVVYERRDYYGTPRWTATGVRVETRQAGEDRQKR